MIKVDVSHSESTMHEYHFSAVRHHRLVVLRELLSLFIFTDSRRALAERTVAKHLCAGTEQRQVGCKLVMCTEKHVGALAYTHFCTHTHTHSRTWSRAVHMHVHNRTQKHSLICIQQVLNKSTFNTHGQSCTPSINSPWDHRLERKQLSQARHMQSQSYYVLETRTSRRESKIRLERAQKQGKGYHLISRTQMWLF